jgi:predicted ATPase with chaperone activity
LDELPEFKKNVLEVMRQPLEEERVTISRAATSHTYPARFMLVAAMNPCFCSITVTPKVSWISLILLLLKPLRNLSPFNHRGSEDYAKAYIKAYIKDT